MTDPHDEQDTAFDRLRRADPARCAEPDLAALRRATQARIADPDFVVVDEEPDDAPGAGSPADGEAPAGGQRRTSRSGWVVAAAVATMLAVGVGGYIAGSQRQAPVYTDSAAEEADTADVAEYAQPERGQDTAGEQDQDDAPEPMGAVPTDTESIRALPVDFIDAGLPTEARQAQAWTVGPPGPDGEPGEMVILGDYPVIPAADAVSRLADPRFNTEVWPRLQDIAGAVPEEQAGAPQPGDALTWSVEQIRLVSAELTVGGYVQPDGTTLMAPLWLLVDDQGRSWPVLAVAEDALDFAIP